nr:cathepsin L-like [Leptinotarsa decemlineata]
MKLTFICFTSLFLFAEGQFGGVFPKLQLSPKSYSIPNPQRIKGSLSFGVGSRDTPAAHVGVHIANPVPATLFTVPPNIPTIGVPVTQHIPIPSAVVVKIPASSNEQKMQEEWNSFRTTFNKVYPTAEEEALRREIFFENRAKIDRLNDEYSQGRRSYVQRLNPFADLLLHEFTRAFNGYNRSTSTPRVSIPQSTAFIPSANVIFPKSVDWREVGAVTDVKYQGKCAACWAFAAYVILIAYVRTTSNQLTSFYFNFSNKIPPITHIYFLIFPGYVDIAENDEKGLEIAIATIGPVTAAIDAGQETFQFYSEGIYDDPACGNKPEQMNHAVLIVGYGQEPDGRKYWLIKNSYGPQWGMGGYFKMAKEAGNQCGIAIQASYPLV